MKIIKIAAIVLAGLAVLVGIWFIGFRSGSMQASVFKNVRMSSKLNNINMKIFSDPVSGVSFRYPKDLIPEVRVSSNSDLSQPFCPVYTWVRLTDPNAHPIELELGSPMQPWIDIMIHKANCNAATQENPTANQTALQQQLSSVANPILAAFIGMVPVHGNPIIGMNGLPTNQNQWVDECQSVSVASQGKLMVSNKKCLSDGGLAKYYGEPSYRQFLQTYQLVRITPSIFADAKFGEELFSENLVNEILMSMTPPLSVQVNQKIH